MSDPSHVSGIVVGVDGSPGSRHALQWILAHRSLVDAPILPVVGLDLPITADGISPLGMLGKGEKHQESAKQQLLETVVDVDPKLLEAAQILQEGHVGHMLVEAADGHDLLVVGSRGRSALAEALLGSVSSFCVSHSRVPVAIIPKETSTTRPISTIVVGVDGSDNAQAALQWAVDHAPPSTTVKAVGIFSFTPYSAVDYQPALEALRDRCRETVETAVAKLDMPETDPPTLLVEIRQGDPRNTLRAEAAGADLLVLGARGHRGVAHLVLGSVTTSLTHHPTVATVVVPQSG